MAHHSTPVSSVRARYAPTGVDPSLGPLVLFAAVALPAGWLLLRLYQVLGLPQEPFVLGTLVLGLVAPVVVLVLPAVPWGAAFVAGGARPATGPWSSTTPWPCLPERSS